VNINLTKIRKDTPGTEFVCHFNNAGSALPPREVIDAQLKHLELEAAIGGYEAADREIDRIEAVYDSIVKLIAARSRKEIAVVENATVAWDMAFYSIPFQPGDRIITSEAEYGANYVAFLQAAKNKGVVVEVVPSQASGELDIAALASMMDNSVKLIAISHVPTNGGLVNPAAAVGQIARAHGALYLLDACQSIGQMPIDVEEIGCDLLSATGRKYLRGPRGIGFLYVRKDIIQSLEPVIIDHFAAEWTSLNIKLTDIGSQQCGIVTFIVDGEDPFELQKNLRAMGINVSVSIPSSTLIDATRRRLPSILRASVHYYNNENEIDRLLRALP
jgi:cysteine desulfurase/selenocysteine lyase